MLFFFEIWFYPTTVKLPIVLQLARMQKCYFSIYQKISKLESHNLDQTNKKCTSTKEILNIRFKRHLHSAYIPIHKKTCFQDGSLLKTKQIANYLVFSTLPTGKTSFIGLRYILVKYLLNLNVFLKVLTLFYQCFVVFMIAVVAVFTGCFLFYFKASL